MTDEQLHARFDGLARLTQDLTGQINQRLDRVDATLANLSKQVAAGTRALAGFTEWTAKADADYTRVLAELADLKFRVAELEGKNGKS
jgi:hypothetical protein